MKILRTSLIILGLLFTVQSLRAQVFPPDFQCIKSDSLFWLAPTNTCGPFVSVDIYSSTQPQGPFNLLTSITDINILTYEDVNPTGEARYYYLISNYNCPGEIALPSDTLATGSIGDSEIIAVDVQGNNVLITWQPSPSLQVDAYVIYRVTDVGTIPIDTVFGQTAFNYLDLGGNPSSGSETYYVIAKDPCDNVSSFITPHSTIFLRGSGETCDEAIELSWEPYSAWTADIDRQEVWVSQDGATPTLAATLDKDAQSYDFTQITQGAIYCFTIRNIESGTNAESNSNEFCIAAQISLPQRELQLTNLSVRTDNTVDVAWYWDLDADLNSYEFLRGNSTTNIETVFSGLPGILLDNQISRIDPTADASQSSFYYQLKTIDECNRTKTSNQGKTIFLTGTAQEDLTNLLNWSPLEIDNVTVEKYRLFKTKGVQTTEVSLASDLEFSKIDEVDPTDPAEVELCYSVMAETRAILPDGSEQTFEAWSNRVCLSQSPLIRIPNAFVPAGFNNLFRPYIIFSEDIDFSMKIFDRWGGLLFETNDYLRGWDGRKGQKEMPMGVYSYIIQLTRGTEQIEKIGTVALIR